MSGTKKVPSLCQVQRKSHPYVRYKESTTPMSGTKKSHPYIRYRESPTPMSGTKKVPSPCQDPGSCLCRYCSLASLLSPADGVFHWSGSPLGIPVSYNFESYPNRNLCVCVQIPVVVGRVAESQQVCLTAGRHV